MKFHNHTEFTITCHHIITSHIIHHIYIVNHTCSHVVITWMVGVAATISQSDKELVPIWTWLSIMIGQSMETLNDINCTVNKNINIKKERTSKPTWYIPELREANRTEVVVEEEWTVTCQILVVVPFAIHVLMQKISTKIIAKWSI
jgi:hypothetical protein